MPLVVKSTAKKGQNDVQNAQTPPTEELKKLQRELENLKEAYQTEVNNIV
ncbi:MAG: hypothetical protein HC817_06115, partial [Saprospiraceae bacterium]|nr:hypothetical protein [Saprospiraceae bacterium]